MADPLTRTSEVRSQKSERLLLELDDASVVLGGTRVLDRLTLSIRVGEHTAILGPNGAGKSTFIKLLTLQQYPAVEERDPSTSSGSARAQLRAEGSSRSDPSAPTPEREGFSRAASIRVFGQERWDVFELRSKLGIVSADLHDRFVHGNSNGVLTGLDAVVSGFFATHGLFRHQRVTDAMRRQAMEALERVDATRLAHATLDTMSTGEARRVLIARALVHQPAALVLDEPTRGLDVVARHHFMERIRAVARQGTTILLVTHHIDEIIPEIERVVLLRRGRIDRDGAKPDVLTAEALSHAFDAPLSVEEAGGYFQVRVS
jgi:iron complex transport system ATP-binding protein